MTHAQNLSGPKNPNLRQSLYDTGCFGVQEIPEVATLVDRLGISKYRPLILPDFETVKIATLLAKGSNKLNDADKVICGWKENNNDGRESYCLGIMDEEVTVAGEYYRCRKHPEEHRTLK